MGGFAWLAWHGQYGWLCSNVKAQKGPQFRSTLNKRREACGSAKSATGPTPKASAITSANRESIRQSISQPIRPTVESCSSD